MLKSNVSIIGVCLNEFVDDIPDNASVYNGIALVQEGLTDLGYQVMNRQYIIGDASQLAKVRDYINTALAVHSTGIPTNVSVMVKPSSPNCYSVMFFN